MSRFIVVSNRLPITIDSRPEGLYPRPSSGGLVTALRNIFKHRPGAWVGWTGTAFDPDVDLAVRNFPSDVRLHPVYLTEEERTHFYYGFSNEIIWPLFHDLQSRCNFDPGYWKSYVDVNERFSEAILNIANEDDLVWVHDYHLALVGSMLNERGCGFRCAYFQHIPFPSLDIFEKLPWRSEFISSLLAYQTVGFQTVRDLKNFAACVRRFSRSRVRRSGDEAIVEHKHGTTRAIAVPISIDFEEFASGASKPETEDKLREFRAEFGDRQIVLGIDRLDYTKGIPERLRAFARALQQYPELRRNVTLVQVVVPSREAIPKYNDLKLEIERLVSQINGQFTDGGWVPIHFVYRHLTRADLLSYYRLASVALVTPLKDGMNLVAKEYCAANIEESGVLILSEFAGVAAQFGSEALVVNPNDIDDVARQIRKAILMPLPERKGRMSLLRQRIRHEDVHKWVDTFLSRFTPSGTLHPFAPRTNSTQPATLAKVVGT